MSLAVPLCGQAQKNAGAVIFGPARPEGAAADRAAEEELTGTTRTVFFDADQEVADRLARALAYHRNQDYREAFNHYREVLRREESVLVRVDDNLLVNSREFCLARTRELPAQFMKSYRLSVDGEAKREFGKAMRTLDVTLLEELSRRYFLSSVGDDILDALAEIYRGRGRPGRAATTWQRLLSWCPDTDRDTALIRVKLTTAAVQAGNVRLARQTVADFEKLHGSRKLTVGGKEVDGLTYLRGLLPEHREDPLSQDKSALNSWSEFGGSVARDGFMPASLASDAWVWSFDLPGAPKNLVSPGPVELSSRTVRVVQQANPVQGLVVGNRAAQIQMWASSRAAPRASRAPANPFLPVYSDGKLFLTDGSGVVCLDAKSGVVRWTTPGYGAGIAEQRRMTAPQRRRQAVRQPYSRLRRHSCVVRDGVVYASLKVGKGCAVLAVDADQGRMLWSVPSGDKDEFDALRSATEVSDPLLYGGKLYVGVRSRKTKESEDDYHLLCINLKDRRLLWKTFVCGASTGTGGGRPTVANWMGVQTPAYGNSMVYVSTGLGGLAAVDAASGEICWGYAYERKISMPNYHQRGQTGGNVAPTVNGGPVLVGSVLCAAPADSEVLYGLDARSGRTLWKVARKGVQTILGAADGTLYLSGSEVWWVDVESGKVRKWTNEKLAFAGQGFLTTDALYVPTDKWIYRFARKSGKLAGKITLDPRRHEAGSLLLVDGRFFSVSRWQVHVFDVWKKAKTELKAAIRATPADPLPYERLGQGHARKQEWLDAIGQYQLALSRYEKGAKLGDKAAVSRVGRILYGLYDRATEQSAAGGKYTEGLTLAGRMRHFAYDETTKVAGTMRVIGFQRLLKRWPDVVAGLQNLLERNPSAMYKFDGSTVMAAGLYAQLEIDKLVKKHGRTCYSRFDLLAGRLAQRGGRQDYQTLLTRYPNSVHVSPALLSLGRILGNSGDYRGAARVMDRLVRREDPKSDADRANALWLTANYWERAGQPRRARSRYIRLAEKYPQARVKVGEVNKTVVGVVRAKLALPELAVAGNLRGAAPSLGVPLQQRWKISMRSGMIVGNGLSGSGGAGRMFLRAEANSLLCLDTSTGKQLWKKGFGTVVRNAVSHGERLLVSLGTNEVVMLEADTGRERWRRKLLTGLPQRMLMDDDDVVMLFGGGRGRRMDILLLGVEDGTERWRSVPAAKQAGWIFLTEDRVGMVSTRPASVMLLDRRTGRLLASLSAVPDSYLVGQPVQLDEDRLMLSVMSIKQRKGLLVCYDIRKGAALWSMPPSHNQVGFRGLTGSKSVTPSGKLAVIISGRQSVSCINVLDGRMAWEKSVAAGRANINRVVVEEEHCYVMEVEIQGTTRITRISKLVTANGKLLWRGELPKGAMGADVLLSADEVLVPVTMWESDARNPRRILPKGGRVVLLDRNTGKMLQTLDPASGTALNPHYMRQTPGVSLSEGRLWVVYPQMVVGYASKGN